MPQTFNWRVNQMLRQPAGNTEYVFGSVYYPIVRTTEVVEGQKSGKVKAPIHSSLEEVNKKKCTVRITLFTRQPLRNVIISVAYGPADNE